MDGQAKKTIALIGSGARALTSAYLLRERFSVDVYGDGADPFVGAEYRGEILTPYAAIMDDKTKEALGSFWQESGLDLQEITPSFGVYSGEEKVTYKAQALFEDSQNVFRWPFWGMVFDCWRLCFYAWRQQKQSKNITFGSFLSKTEFGGWFKTYHVSLVACSVMGLSRANLFKCSTRYVLNRLERSGLLCAHKQAQPFWSMTAGCRSFLLSMKKSLEGQTQSGWSVKHIHRTQVGVIIQSVNEQGQMRESPYDAVVFAGQKQELSNVITDKDEREDTVFARAVTQNKKITLHTDKSIMPEGKVRWPLFLCHMDKVRPLDDAAAAGAKKILASLTLHLSAVQHGIGESPVFATVDAIAPIDPGQIIQETEIETQTIPDAFLLPIQGHRNCFYINGVSGLSFDECDLSPCWTLAQRISLVLK